MLGGDFDTPIMYQDLGKYTMGGIPPMYGGMYGSGIIGNSSYLGGVQIRPQLDHDKVQLINKKNKEGKDTFKKAMLGIGACLLLGFIPVIKKGIKKSGGVGKYIKDVWTSLTAPKAKKTSLWQRIKNKFKKNSSNNTSSPSTSSRIKGWCSAKWNSFKKLFKKKTPVQP